MGERTSQGALPVRLQLGAMDVLSANYNKIRLEIKDFQTSAFLKQHICKNSSTQRGFISQLIQHMQQTHTILCVCFMNAIRTCT